MATVPIRVDLINFIQAERGILREVEITVNKRLSFAIPSIYSGLSIILQDAFLDSPEYQALLPGGELYGSLGVTFARQAAEQIIDSLRADLKLNVVGPTLQVEIFKGDYSSLLNIPLARFISEKGRAVDWLEWLLTRGTSTVVSDYSFVPGFFKSSRTGQGAMLRLTTGVNKRIRHITRSSDVIANPGPYSVPEQYSGTPSSNWVVRALNRAEPKIISLIEVEAFKALSR